MKYTAYIIAIICLISLPAYGDDFVKTYTFEEPIITTEGASSLITMSGTLNTQQAGYPCIPFVPVRILIPYGHEVDQVTVTHGRAYPLSLSRIRPAPNPIRTDDPDPHLHPLLYCKSPP